MVSITINQNNNSMSYINFSDGYQKNQFHLFLTLENVIPPF